MSEEEKKAIERVNKAIEDDKKSRIVTIYDEKPLFRDVLQTLLNLINKQQKEIEQLKEDKKSIETMLSEKYEKYFTSDYIHKDKIREKIKEVSNGTYDAKIILEKLLEE